MWRDVAFGPSKESLTTVGYRLYNNTGSDAKARTTTGVVEIGHGNYGVDIAIEDMPADAVGIEWDTGEATPIYACEQIGVNIQYVNETLVGGNGNYGNRWGPAE